MKQQLASEGFPNDYPHPRENYQRFHAPTGSITFGYNKWNMQIGSFIIKGADLNTLC